MTSVVGGSGRDCQAEQAAHAKVRMGYAENCKYGSHLWNKEWKCKDETRIDL